LAFRKATAGILFSLLIGYQMLGDLHGFSSILRSDPLSRLAALLLPSDALAMLPIVQDLTETEMLEAGYAR
jgi:hypothetical protein